VMAECRRVPLWTGGGRGHSLPGPLRCPETLALATLTLVLSQGTRRFWFENDLIFWSTAASIGAWAGFVFLVPIQHEEGHQWAGFVQHRTSTIAKRAAGAGRDSRLEAYSRYHRIYVTALGAARGTTKSGAEPRSIHLLQ
jgi:hypothetical protein